MSKKHSDDTIYCPSRNFVTCEYIVRKRHSLLVQFNVQWMLLVL